MNDKNLVGIIKGLLPMIITLAIKYALIIVLQIIFIFIFYFTYSGYNVTKTDAINYLNDNIVLMNIISNVILLIGFGIFYKIKYANNNITTKKTYKKKDILSIIMFAVGLKLVIAIFSMVTSMILPSMVSDYSDEIKQMDLLNSGNFINILFIVIVAPIIEELIFRGVTIRICEKEFKNTFVVVLIQGIAFGIYHLQPFQMIYASLLGIAFGYIYMRYRSLTLCILLHMVFNGLTFVLMDIISENIYVLIAIIVIGVVCAVYSTIAIFKGWNKEKSNTELSITDDTNYMS